MFLSSLGLFISVGFFIDSLIAASLTTLFFINCSLSFLNFSFSSFLNFSFSSFNCLFSTSWYLLIIFSNKSFLTNFLLGWNVIFGVNSFLYFWVDESLYLSNINCQLTWLSICKPLLLTQKHWLLFGSIIVSKSHIWQLSIVISNILILYPENFIFLNNTKYLVTFYFLYYTQKKNIFFKNTKYLIIFYFLYYTQNFFFLITQNTQ